jgi:hypothetical protein
LIALVALIVRAKNQAQQGIFPRLFGSPMMPASLLNWFP